jgi:hypothetical protein
MSSSATSIALAGKEIRNFVICSKPVVVFDAKGYFTFDSCRINQSRLCYRDVDFTRTSQPDIFVLPYSYVKERREWRRVRSAFKYQWFSGGNVNLNLPRMTPIDLHLHSVFSGFYVELDFRAIRHFGYFNSIEKNGVLASHILPNCALTSNDDFRHFRFIQN